MKQLKSEYRNPKPETNPKFESSIVLCERFPVLVIRVCFGFRASDFEFKGGKVA